ncbi:MAG: UTP--glucose-1-phosphate uridylyltransferase [Ignavibacteriae bacterium]|nr:UTP--glucose-1-phosphate uridylyltransferase [Ignavibacteriota bacterium]
MHKNSIEKFRKKMEDENLPKIVTDTFEFYYNQLLSGETGMLPESEIFPIDALQNSEKLDNEFENFGKEVLQNSVMIKLNGGLGTSMGLSEAKSLLKIKNDLTFLDIIVKQTINSKIPLVLMNSFNTEKKSLEVLKKYPELNNKIPFDFLQHKIPKINSNNYEPVEFKENENLEWCPPGHGEIYTALFTSGMLEKLLSHKFEFAFISNSDNLGAVMDLRILGYFAKNKFPFLMEVTERTEADKKGGHLAKLQNDQFVLRESAQCLKSDEIDFQNIEKHKFFNTNNIWINLKALQNILKENNNILGLPMIVNKKTVDPRNSNSQSVFQLETAMGSAISVFNNASAICVPRTRFAPVKTTDDLLAVRSDNYILTENFRVIINPERKLQPLFVRLDSKNYKLVDDLDEKIPFPLSLVNCEKLVINGNYSFGKNVKLIGNVFLENKTTEQIKINDNSIITSN